MHYPQTELLHSNQSFLKSSPARPFLKWAGGKGQLLSELEARFPQELKIGKISKYFEPFAGGGAVFFLIAAKYQTNPKRKYFNDINRSLMLVYKVIQNDVNALIGELESLAAIYDSMSVEDQEVLFYNIRDEYNQRDKQVELKSYQEDWVETAAKMIFLNKTCFNGLYRENKSGDFNVPFGRYKNPSVLDEDNLFKASEILQNVELSSDDFTKIKKKVTKDSFVYFDPPYRPISRTSSFTSYSGSDFGDDQQIRLANLFKELDKKGAKLMLSNSDPKNENPTDDFFERNYKGFNIARVTANRMINCDATKRGAINELIITNY